MLSGPVVGRRTAQDGAITRRQLLRWGAGGTLGALGAGLLSGCAMPASSARMSAQSPVRPGQKVSLTFWTWVPVQTVVDQWNRERPDIQVNLQVIPSGSTGGYQKMYSALRAGNAPDLAHVEYQELPSFMLVQGLTDLSPYGAEQYREDYVDWQWQQGVFGNGVFTIPWASGPMAMFYRTDLFAEWDITPPATWTEFEAAARLVRKREPGAYLHSFPPSNAAWFEGLAWQAGGEWVTSDGDTWIVGIDNPQTRKVAAFWDRLIRDDLVMVENDGTSAWYKQIQDGLLGCYVSADWYDALIEDGAPNTAGKWQTTGMPQWTPGAQTAANWGGSSVAVLQGSRYPTQAMEFAHWFGTNVSSVNATFLLGSGWPALQGAFGKTVLSHKSAFFGDTVYNEAFNVADAHINTNWRFLPTNDAMIDHMNDAFSAAIAGNGSLEATLPQVQELAIEDMKAKYLNVRAA
jgi:multiple sugar transport system substrate-binding protein